jgi:hypothetical protein
MTHSAGVCYKHQKLEFLALKLTPAPQSSEILKKAYCEVVILLFLQLQSKNLKFWALQRTVF